MRSIAVNEMIRLAYDEKSTSPFAELVKLSIEDGFISGERLKKNLEEAGYELTFKPGEKHGVFLTITKNTTVPYHFGDTEVNDAKIVGYAFAENETEAVKQAIFAELKAEESTRNS